jgi:hypothetical protein
MSVSYSLPENKWAITVMSRERKKIKKGKDYTDTTKIMISPLSLKRSWRDEFNNTKKNHQQWPEWVTRDMWLTCLWMESVAHYGHIDDFLGIVKFYSLRFF